MVEVEIYSASKEYLRAAVESNRDEVTNGMVEFGFTDSEDTEATAWTLGAWYSNEQTVENINNRFVKSFVAQILVSGIGSGGDVELDEGEHFAWTRVTMSDGQSPVKLAGKVTVL